MVWVSPPQALTEVFLTYICRDSLIKSKWAEVNHIVELWYFWSGIAICISNAADAESSSHYSVLALLSKKPENKYWKHQREFIVYQDCILWKKPAWNRLSFTSMHPDFSSEQKYWTFLHTHYRQKESFSISVDRSRREVKKNSLTYSPSAPLISLYILWPLRWDRGIKGQSQHGKAFAILQDWVVSKLSSHPSWQSFKPWNIHTWKFCPWDRNS